MATATLTASSNHTHSSGTVTYLGGSSNYTVLTDADDATYVTVGGSNGYVIFPLTDTAGNMSTITGVVINVRLGEVGMKGDQVQFAGAQIFKSDRTTAITNNCTASSGFVTTFNLTPSSIFYTDKTSWDGAVIKLLNDFGTDGSIAYYELSISITYNLSDPIDYTENSSGGYALGGSSTNAMDSTFTTSGGISFGGTSPNIYSTFGDDLIFETSILEISQSHDGVISDINVDKLTNELTLKPIVITQRRVVR